MQIPFCFVVVLCAAAVYQGPDVKAMFYANCLLMVLVLMVLQSNLRIEAPVTSIEKWMDEWAPFFHEQWNSKGRLREVMHPETHGPQSCLPALFGPR